MPSDVYQLRCADAPLVDFIFTEDDFGTFSTEVVAVHDGYRGMLPWGIVPSDEGIYRWLSSRSLPRDRRYAFELCAALGISTNDVQGICDVSAALSLNDSYWVPKAEAPRPFADVNLFKNGFPPLLADVAFTGAFPMGHGRYSRGSVSPELT